LAQRTSHFFISNLILFKEEVYLNAKLLIVSTFCPLT